MLFTFVSLSLSMMMMMMHNRQFLPQRPPCKLLLVSLQFKSRILWLLPGLFRNWSERREGWKSYSFLSVLRSFVVGR